MSFFAYQQTNDTSMPVDEVEAWLNEFPQKRAENKPNGGIIRSTASITFIDGARANRTKREKQQAIALARREHKAAMRELAIQDRKDQIEIAKKRKIWAKEMKAANKDQTQEMTPKQKSIANRKDAIERDLRVGNLVFVPNNKGETRNEYQVLRRDILAVKKRFTNSIVRLKCLDSSQSYYTIDTIETFNSDIDYSDMDSIVAALKTKKAVRINGNMSQEEVKSLAGMVRKIEDVTAIYSLDNSIKGWVML